MMDAGRFGPVLPERKGLSGLPLKLAADGAPKHIGKDERLSVAVRLGPRSRSEINPHDGERFAGDVWQVLLKHRPDRLDFARADGSEDRESDACSDQTS